MAITSGRRIGYRIWAKGDRCVPDWDLRQARKRLARAIASGDARLIERARQCEGWAMEDVAAWEARYGLGRVAR